MAQKDIKTQKTEELFKALAEKKESLRVLRSNVGTNKSKNVKEQMSIKKDIARLLTEINNRK